MGPRARSGETRRRRAGNGETGGSRGGAGLGADRGRGHPGAVARRQPWRFIAGPERLHVYLDPERALPVLDPTGRQQIISCGSAIEFAVVALRAAGRDTEVDLLTDDGDRTTWPP